MHMVSCVIAICQVTMFQSQIGILFPTSYLLGQFVEQKIEGKFDFGIRKIYFGFGFLPRFINL